MEITQIIASITEVEKLLAAVEKNGVTHIYTQEGNFPCGGCRTYQAAVLKALKILRSLNHESGDDPYVEEVRDEN